MHVIAGNELSVVKAHAVLQKQLDISDDQLLAVPVDGLL